MEVVLIMKCMNFQMVVQTNRNLAAGSKSAIDRKQLADAANPLLQLWKKLCQGSDLHNRAVSRELNSSTKFQILAANPKRVDRSNS